MEKLDFEGRVAIVTGAGRGMGRSHALMLASRGARVVVNDITGRDGDNPADAVVAEIIAAGGEAVASRDSVVTGADAIVATAIDAFGRLDILVNNAGVMSSATLADARQEDWETVFDIHFTGTVRVTRAAWPHLVASGSGRVISTASSGMLGNAGLTSYGSAKGATWAFMRSAAIEGEPDGICCHTILPTAKSRITDTIDDPAITATIERYFQPDHVSAMVVWLAHQDTRLNNGTWQVSGGRGGRMVFAAYPTVRVDESTPEMWAAKQDALLADGPLMPLATTAEMFGNELADADPAIRHAMGAERGGLGLKPTTGRESG